MGREEGRKGEGGEREAGTASPPPPKKEEGGRAVRESGVSLSLSHGIGGQSAGHVQSPWRGHG